MAAAEAHQTLSEAALARVHADTLGPLHGEVSVDRLNHEADGQRERDCADDFGV